MDEERLRREWKQQGVDYAAAVNQMIAFGDAHGWETWKGPEPEDKRDHLADGVIARLRKANATGTVDEFRANYPPAHAPFIEYYQQYGQSIEHVHFIADGKIVFLTGAAYEQRQAYLLDGDTITQLDTGIAAIGKSKRNDVFALQYGDEIITTRGWQGETIAAFRLRNPGGLKITELIPFNDGLTVLSVTAEGIFLIDRQQELLIHPEAEVLEELEEDRNYPILDMENGTLSHDNRFIVVGDQSSDHRVLDARGQPVGTIGPQSSYPHYCLFSADDRQLITNSCHFYNGITIGVDSDKLNGIALAPYEEDPSYTTIDENMRVYCGLAYDDLYVLGDAYGYIRAIDQWGKVIWQHFVGSTISGMTVSDDRKTLWVASHAGMLHKLRLGLGHRDRHTIGNGDHYEDFRLIFWKGEPVMRW